MMIPAQSESHWGLVELDHDGWDLGLARLTLAQTARVVTR